MNTFKKGRDYEIMVKNFLEKVFEEDGITDIEFEHDVKLKKKVGTGTQQYDLVGISKKGGIPIRYLIECKNYNNKVDQQIVDGFRGKIESTRSEPYMASVGVIVTTEGFQKGALEEMENFGIIPILIREPKDEDKGNLMWDFYFTIGVGSLEPCIELGINEEDKGILESKSAYNIYGFNKIIDKKNEQVIDLYDLVKEAESRPDEKTIHQFEDALFSSSKGELPIKELRISFQSKTVEVKNEIHGDDIVAYCYRVLGDKETKFFMRKDGTVFKSES